MHTTLIRDSYLTCPMHALKTQVQITVTSIVIILNLQLLDADSVTTVTHYMKLMLGITQTLQHHLYLRIRINSVTLHQM